jgi:hypothetical protein
MKTNFSITNRMPGAAQMLVGAAIFASFSPLIFIAEHIFFSGLRQMSGSRPRMTWAEDELFTLVEEENKVSSNRVQPSATRGSLRPRLTLLTGKGRNKSTPKGARHLYLANLR